MRDKEKKIVELKPWAGSGMPAYRRLLESCGLFEVSNLEVQHPPVTYEGEPPMIHDSEKPIKAGEVIDVRSFHADEIAARLREMGGTFREYGKPNTVFRPSEGSPPLLYYSPQRPTRRLRFLCWLIGARLDYLPDMEITK